MPREGGRIGVLVTGTHYTLYQHSAVLGSPQIREYREGLKAAGLVGTIKGGLGKGSA